MTSNDKKMPRIQKKAIDEITTVKDCLSEVKKYLDKIKQKKDGSAAQLAVLEERGSQCMDEDILSEIADEIMQIEDTLGRYSEVYDVSRAVLKQLNVLLDNLELLYGRKKYRYIVRKVPEKKLSTMVFDESKIEVFLDLVIGINSDMRKMIERLKAATVGASAADKQDKADHEVKMEVIGGDKTREQEIVARLRGMRSNTAGAMSDEDVHASAKQKNNN